MFTHLPNRVLNPPIDLESKYYVLYDNALSLSGMFYHTLGALFGLFLGVVFLSARISPAACILSAAAIAAVFKATSSPNSHFNTRLFVGSGLNQCRMAREILGMKEGAMGIPV